MSAANPPRGPRAAQTVSHSSSHAPATNVTPTQISAKIDLLISLSLHSWPALTLAIQNHWGGPSSTDKRDWFAGAISDLFSTQQIADADDLEAVLLQVMLDEFEVVVDDDSPMEIALKIAKGREKILKGDFSEVDGMYKVWEGKQGKGSEKINFQRVDEDDEGQDTDWDDEEDGEEDEEMGEAPALVEKPKREKVEPIVDEEGFTQVLGKKKR